MLFDQTYIKKSLLFPALSILLVVGVVHYFSINNALYFYYQWLDIPVHFLGGLWTGFIFFWFFSRFSLDFVFVNRKTIIISLMVCALSVGLIWEVFEFFAKIAVLVPDIYLIDTIKDLFTDVLGALVSYIYFIKTAIKQSYIKL
jgi:hypothetical protein